MVWSEPLPLDVGRGSPTRPHPPPWPVRKTAKTIIRRRTPDNTKKCPFPLLFKHIGHFSMPWRFRMKNVLQPFWPGVWPFDWPKNRRMSPGPLWCRGWRGSDPPPSRMGGGSGPPCQGFGSPTMLYASRCTGVARPQRQTPKPPKQRADCHQPTPPTAGLRGPQCAGGHALVRPAADGGDGLPHGQAPGQGAVRGNDPGSYPPKMIRWHPWHTLGSNVRPIRTLARISGLWRVFVAG